MSRTPTGRIHSFESFGTLDGPGIRYVVFFQGCPLRCKFCHNPDTWHPDAGSEKSVEEIISAIESCRSFFKRGGVTLSGGEPLLQAEFALELLKVCKQKNIHSALDTAGSLPLEKSRAVLETADLILLDIKSLDQQLCTELTGTGNKNTLATLDFCEKIGKKVWIRHVLIPGLTYQKTLLEQLAEYLRSFKCIERIELLPYHKMAAEKWHSSGMCDPLASTAELNEEQKKQAAELFRKYFSYPDAPEIL